MRFNRLFLLTLMIFLVSAYLSAEPVVHILQKGETIYGVARKYSVPFDAVIAANNIQDPRKVFPGTKLVIPVSHRVSKGETLYGIARSYGVSLEDLRKANKLDTRSLIKPGDVLVIPGGSRPVPETAPPSAAADGSGQPVPSGESPAETSAKAGGKPAAGASWPVEGDAVYLDGKLFGVGIRTEKNSSIRTVRSGTVVSAGPFRGFGRVAFIQAKDGLIYVYGGAETLNVRIGESVRAGVEIGKVGLDLKEGLPIAYFLVFHKGNALDPAKVPRE